MRNKQRGTDVRVLLVDDEPDLTASLRQGMRRQTGWTVDTANSGEEALELCESNRYDAVVSDERMPGMQGSDLLTILRYRWPDTIRVTLSGQASLERALVAINAADVHRFLLKPCPREEIVATIDELLAARAFIAAKTRATVELANRGSVELRRRFDLALRDLWVAFQPIFAIEGELLGHEALVRSDTTALGTPDLLFRAAHELGRADELAGRIARETARAIDLAPPSSLVFVNVNPEHLLGEGILDRGSPLAAHAERVVIEVTERTAVIESASLDARLSTLSELGYRIAVDDLGAGYSGLNSFLALRPAFVKFDAAMIRAVDLCSTKQAVIGALATLCRTLQVQVIAEGVETMEELDTLRNLGCGYVQGFLIGRPSRQFHGLPRDEAA